MKALVLFGVPPETYWPYVDFWSLVEAKFVDTDLFK